MYYEFSVKRRIDADAAAEVAGEQLARDSGVKAGREGNLHIVNLVDEGSVIVVEGQRYDHGRVFSGSKHPVPGNLKITVGEDLEMGLEAYAGGRVSHQALVQVIDAGHILRICHHYTDSGKVNSIRILDIGAVACRNLARPVIEELILVRRNKVVAGDGAGEGNGGRGYAVVGRIA